MLSRCIAIQTYLNATEISDEHLSLVLDDFENDINIDLLLFDHDSVKTDKTFTRLMHMCIQNGLPRNYINRCIREYIASRTNQLCRGNNNETDDDEPIRFELISSDSDSDSTENENRPITDFYNRLNTT
ncbi:unnamed protein product [Owenia fusiformis]|uniref:Uncharacterized protein n=1 Tax=Owenia fusiformis TaxID=6347 RepID=A0A8S4NXT8_OWEFU|nr:unnamed protein product [Owenia fusiformis]